MNWFETGLIVAAVVSFFVLGISFDFHLRRISENHATVPDKLRNKLGEAYQIVGYLADEAGLFHDPAVVMALDHFADPDDYLDVNLLPWVPEGKPEPKDVQ